MACHDIGGCFGRVFRTACVLGATFGAFVASADGEWNGNGTLTVESLDALNAINPLYLGTGTIRYLGESGTYTGTLTLNGPEKKMGTVEVAEGRNLTVTSVSSPEASATNGFVKSGTGTLTFKNVTATRVGSSAGGTGATGYTPHWDANGNFDTNSDASFLLYDGTLVVDGGEMSCSGNLLIGSRGTNAPCMKLVNGAKFTAGSSLYMGRGTHSTNANQKSSLYLDGGSTFVAYAFSSGWQNGMPNPYSPNCLVDIRGGSWLKLGNGERVYFAQSYGQHEINVTGSSKMTTDRDQPVSGAFRLGDSSNATGRVTVTDNSLLGAYSLGIMNNHSLVMEDSTLAFDRTVMNNYYGNGMLSGGQNRGYACLDGVTLSNYTARTMGVDWFTTQTNIVIGAKGLTVKSTSAEAVMDSIPVAKAGTSGQTIVKAGAARVALRPSSFPVTATEGPLAFYTGSTRTRAYNDASSAVPSATVTGAAGQPIEGLGEYAFANMALAHPNGSIRLAAQGEEAHSHGWKCNMHAWTMPGGVLRLTPGNSALDTCGVAVNREKIRVDQSFTVRWNYYAERTTSTVANGCFFFVETTPGLTVDSSKTASWGLASMTKSFAAGMENGARAVRFIENGAYVDDATHKQSIESSVFPQTHSDPLECCFAYDAALHRVTFSFSDSRGHWEFTYDVDLETVCGASEAYYGFSAVNQRAYPTDHCITRVRVEQADSRKTETVPMGGRLTVAAGATQAVTLDPLGVQAGFEMNSLSYGNGATLDIGVARPNSYQASHPDSPSLADSSQWNTWSSYSTEPWRPVWREDGSVILATNMVNPNVTAYTCYTYGGIATKAAYPLTGDWTVAFDYDFGKSSATAADIISCSVGPAVNADTRYASTGLSLTLRYYNSGTTPVHATTISFRANSVLKQADGASSTMPVMPVIDLQKQRKVHIAMAYDDTLKQLSITLSNSAGSESYVYSNIDYRTLLGYSSNPNVPLMSKIGFHAEVGGSWAENLVSNLQVTNARMEKALVTDTRTDEASLAFASLSGSGTLVKKGAGALNLIEPGASPIAALRVEEGGLRLGKRSLDPYLGAGSGFVFSDYDGSYRRGGGPWIGRFSRSNPAITANSRRRVRIDRSWQCTFSLDMRHPTNNDTSQADAVVFFLHNSSRGNEACGTCYDNAAYIGGGFDKSVAVGWNIYNSSSNTKYGKTYYGTDGNWTDKTKDYGLRLYGRVTDVTIAWDRSTQKLISVLSRTGEDPVTNELATIDIPAKVGDSHAYIGFGTGGGGSQSEPAFDDLCFETTEDIGDTLADTAYATAATFAAAETTVTLDSSVVNGTYRLASSVSFTSADAALVATAADAAGTLELGAVTVEGTNVAFRAEGGAKISVDAVSGTGLKKVTVSGGTLVVTSATALDAGTGLVLADGAKVELAFAGTLQVKWIEVAGETVRGCYGSGARSADWIAAGSTGRVNTERGTMIIIR